MKAEEFDEKFDRGEDVTEFFDTQNAKRPGREQKRINIDLPTWMIQLLEKEAKRLGVNRQAIIKIFLAERLQHI